MTLLEQVIEQVEILVNQYGFQTASWLLGEMLDITTESAKMFMWLLGF